MTRRAGTGLKRGRASRPYGAWAAAYLMAIGPIAACSEPPLGVAGDPSDGLVFVRTVNGSNEIIRVRLSDGEERALTRTADREETWPYWSQAARRLVFQVARPGAGANSDLVLWNPETGAETPLGETPRRDERWPVWSPDGRALAYAFRGGEPRAGVTLADLSGGPTRVIAASGVNDFFFRPSFSPDGERLVAQRRGPDGRGSNLWLLSATAPPRPLTDDPAWFDMKAWFTRDGSALVYSRRPRSGGPYDLASLSATGGAPRILASTPASDDHSGRPSPVRDEIAFVSDRAGSFDLYLADLSGERVRRLAESPESNELAPRWSPDGERIVVLRSAREDAPRLVQRVSLAEAHIAVFDREGWVLLETPGGMADWMPPWP